MAQAVAVSLETTVLNGSPAHSADDISVRMDGLHRKVADIYIDAFLPTHIPVIANLYEGFSNQRDQGWLAACICKGHEAAVKEGVLTHCTTSTASNCSMKRRRTFCSLPARRELCKCTRRACGGADPELGTYGIGCTHRGELAGHRRVVLTFGIDVWNLYSGL